MSDITICIITSTIKLFKMNASEQVIAPNEIQDCPICMDPIDGLCNRVVTECGHVFHCSCLMKNVSHNGFDCPYCRTIMAKEPEEEEEDDDDYGAYNEDEMPMFDNDALTSFRMFHQQINGEDIEEEEEEEEDEDEDEEEEEDSAPKVEYVSHKLSERGISFDDLAKYILYQDHSNWGSNYDNLERRASEVFGQFKAILTQYERHNNSVTI